MDARTSFNVSGSGSYKFRENRNTVQSSATQEKKKIVTPNQNFRYRDNISIGLKSHMSHVYEISIGQITGRGKVVFSLILMSFLTTLSS